MGCGIGYAKFCGALDCPRCGDPNYDPEAECPKCGERMEHQYGPIKDPMTGHVEFGGYYECECEEEVR